MIKNIFSLSLLTFTGFLLFAQTSPVEAKHHCKSRSSFHVNVGTRSSDTLVTRRVVRPVAPTTVIVPQYSTYYTPVYTYEVVPVAPVYYEEVYVTPAPRPVRFGGLSFSLEFF
nr:hypothetical protein OJOKFFHK_00023 [uncultured bacterium]